MFPSSGSFAVIACPFFQRGLCERPHCLFKHDLEVRDMFGGSRKTSLDDAAGVQNGYSSTFCRAPVIHQTKDVCLQELERINQEIENVKHEVEREERRLCCYHSVDVVSKPSSCRFDTAGKGAAGGPNGRPLSADPTKAEATSHKYVIDNSKPRTDLEYDPMSNFSADFGSYRQSAKDQKVKNGQGLKRARNSDQSDGVKSATYQAQLSRMRSPEPLDDSYDDSILIIDIPPSPNRKRASAREPVECVPVSAQDELKEWRNSSSKLPVDAETFKVMSSPKSLLNKEYNCAAEKRHNKSCEMMADSRNMMDLERYLEDLNSERQGENLKRPLPASPPHTLLLQRMREEASPQSSYKTSAGSSCLPCKLSKHTPKTEQFTDAHQLSLRQSNWKTSSERPAETQVKSVSSDNFPQRDEPASDSSWHQISHIAFVSSQMTKAAGSKAEQPAVRAGNEDVILIDSSGDDNEEEDEECPYSDVDLSDSDPMEECYRIFMEANEKTNETTRNQMQPEVSVGALEASKLEVEVKPQGIPGKRMAHEVKHTELPVPKGRPEPQVLVPLRGPAVPGFAPQLSMAPKLQQAPQMASVLSASVRGGQAFVSSTAQRKLDIQTAVPVPVPAPAPQAVAQTTPTQNAYMNCIPLGAAVIDVGNNLHLILPQGTFPLPTTSTSSPVTSVLTPINQVHVSPVGGKHMQAPGILTPVPKYRTAAPLLISAPARKPSPTLTFANTATTAPSHSAAVAKPAAGKRKGKQVGEAAKEKVPHDVRQRYVNMFTEEFLKTTPDINEAFEKALAEEKTVYNRSMNKLKYLSIAVNALKRLKSQSATTAVKDEKGISQRSKGKITLNRKMLKRNDDTALYESLRDYILPEGTLIENNYPVQHPEKPYCAILFAESKKANTDPLKRICCRCGATYSVSSTGKHTRKEECNYHYGKGVEKRVPGGVETRYSCCEGVMGAPGCQVFKLHVHDSISLEGFAATSPRQPTDGSCPGIYAVDCEMCYTINGLELSRVTVVNSGLQVVYDSFIRPDNEVIDYNTRFSGISEADVKGNCTSLKEVQEILLSFINADTILIGHGLETSLCALKLFHGTVVDTSIVFPHRLGPPHKLTLNTLTAEYLRRIIQESVCGHDTADDAAACMELMLWKVKDGKLKK